jgi:ribosomal protein L11 methyltransferase
MATGMGSPPVRCWPAIEIAFDAPAEGERLLLALDGHSPAGIHEESDRAWRIVFGTAEARDRAARSLTRILKGTARINPVDVPDENWAERTQRDLRAVVVGRIVVAPPWDVPEPAVDRIVIIVRPSTGFGTGHHASTRLALQLMQDVALAGRRVLDVGTGSGVLALAAARLGAVRVAAVDSDPDALEAARGNLALNPGCAVDFRLATLGCTSDLPASDVVLANLTGTLLQREARSLAALVAPGGQLIASGLLDHEQRMVLEVLGGGVRAVRSEDGWSAIAFQPGEP